MRTVSGQVAVEFVLMIASAIVVGIVFLSVSSAYFIDAADQQRVAAMDDLGYMIQDELILASTVEDGYSRIFLIPEKADRFVYTLAADATSVTLTSGKVVLTYPMPEHTGTIAKGWNMIAKDGGIAIS